MFYRDIIILLVAKYIILKVLGFKPVAIIAGIWRLSSATFDFEELFVSTFSVVGIDLLILFGTGDYACD